MDSKKQFIKDEYKELCSYLSKIDRVIKTINKEAKNDFKESRKLIFRIYDILEKKELTDEDLNILAQSVNSYFFELGKYNQSVFHLICFHIVKEKERTKSVRERFFQILQTIVSKEDFSVFETEENVIAFEDLYEEFGTENIDFLAIFKYLTSQEKIRSMVTGAVSRNGLASTSIRLNKFCYFLEKNDEKIYVHR